MAWCLAVLKSPWTIEDEERADEGRENQDQEGEDDAAPADSRAVTNRAEWREFRAQFANNTLLADELYGDRPESVLRKH